MATNINTRNRATNLWLCRYCENDSNSFCESYMSPHLCLHPSTAAAHPVQSRSSPSSFFFFFKITTLCALFKSNCELAAVCEQSSTHCVLSSYFTACPCMRRALRDLLVLKDSGGDRGGLCVVAGESVSHSARSVTGLCFLSLVHVFNVWDVANGNEE